MRATTTGGNRRGENLTRDNGEMARHQNEMRYSSSTAIDAPCAAGGGWLDGWRVLGPLWWQLIAGAWPSRLPNVIFIGDMAGVGHALKFAPI
uniref:Uncharacterized protein n=1 Tax=Plectus sambesii TaxID=2011161 RepID=A0A914XFL3_9BILA